MSIQDDRLRALNAFYDAAKDADWQAITTSLAAVVPVPKKSSVRADDGEWCDYTAAQSRGSFKYFASGRTATVEFKNGVQIIVQLQHRTSQELPNWGRACRCAVSFYKANRAAKLLEALGASWGCQAPSRPEKYANSCKVPEIARVWDNQRECAASVTMANEVTEPLRDGPLFGGSRGYAEHTRMIAA